MISCGLQYKPLLEDNIEILYHGRIYILVPLETWRRGLLYSLPVLAGYAVVGENGDITCIPADRLRESPLMKGLPLLPEKIARDWVETYRYSVGFIAFYFYHNTYVIRDVGTNPQPYLEQGSMGGSTGCSWRSQRGRPIARSTSYTSTPGTPGSQEY